MHVAERTACGREGLGRTEAARLELPLLHLTVEIELLSEVGLEPAMSDRVAEAADQPSHLSLSRGVEHFVNSENQSVEFVPFN